MKTFIKKAIGSNKTTKLFVLYILLLVWFKEYVYGIYLLHGLIKSALLLIIFPVFLGVTVYLRNLKQKSSTHDKLTIIKQLSDNQQYLLRQNAPTSQLDLLNDVLLVSLGLIYDLLHNIKSESKNDATLFDEKFTKIVELFKQTKQRPEFINCTITSRSRNNAILMFAFYRILFFGVMEQASKQGILDSHADKFILLKRIPPKVAIFLGSQTWRLYELNEIINGSLDNLTLNDDIKTTLSELCNTPQTQFTKPTHDNDNFAVNKKEILLEKKEKVYQLSNDSIKEVAFSPGVEIPRADIKTTEIEQENEVKNARPELSDQSLEMAESSALAKKFNKWLQRQISRYPINQGERFYCDINEHGKQLLFISDIGLSDFAKKDRINIELLKESLKASGIANKDSYQLQKDNKTQLMLLAIKIDFDIDIVHTLNGKVVR